MNGVRLCCVRAPLGTMRWKGDWSEFSQLWESRQDVARAINPILETDSEFYISFDDLKHSFWQLLICARGSTNLSSLKYLPQAAFITPQELARQQAQGLRNRRFRFKSQHGVHSCLPKSRNFVSLVGAGPGPLGPSSHSRPGSRRERSQRSAAPSGPATRGVVLAETRLSVPPAWSPQAPRPTPSWASPAPTRSGSCPRAWAPRPAAASPAACPTRTATPRGGRAAARRRSRAGRWRAPPPGASAAPGGRTGESFSPMLASGACHARSGLFLRAPGPLAAF